MMTVPFKLLLMCIIFCLLCSSCSRQAAVCKGVIVAGPLCIVYKTKADYSGLVPVMLSADKSKIVSYPDVRDLVIDGKPVVPTPLLDGYLLDNRGIGPDVAFLTLSLWEYSRMTTTPDAARLYGLILDKEPLAEMYECGKRYQYSDPAEAMNQLIRNGKLKGQKRLK